MILHGAVADNAWEYYAEQVRRDPSNVYFASRLLEHGHRIIQHDGGEDLLRAATLTVYRADPFAYVTSMSIVSASDLADTELNEISDGLDRAGDQDTTNFLRGMLWTEVGRSRSDSAAVAQRAHGYLVQVSEEAAAREPDYWPAIAECYRLTDYEKFKEVLPKALESKDPEWRARLLIHALEEVVQHEDWQTYAKWRPLWDALPQNAHICECHITDVFTYDGLAALHQGNLSAIPDLMRRALSVRGCPHLNSGGPAMDLAEALIARGVLLDEAERYLDSSEELFGENSSASRVRKHLAASRGTSMDAAPGRDGNL